MAYNELHKLDWFLKFIKKTVKSFQKQICVEWECGSLKEFSSFCHYYRGIHCCIGDELYKNRASLPLYMFSTVSNLTLDGIFNTTLEGLAGGAETNWCFDDTGAISRVPSDIYALTSKNCFYLKDISEIKKIGTLKSVNIVNCEKLEDSSSLANIEDVLVDGTFHVSSVY
jgi:hypothetical protein